MRFLATHIYNVILKTDSKIASKIYLKFRAIVLKFSNPLIDISFRGFRFIMPFSHTIFIFQKMYPNYDMALGKIARIIRNKQGYLNMIDVGANIGDTACFSKVSDARYLLIEGESSYSRLIPTNIAYNYGKIGGAVNKIMAVKIIAGKMLVA